MTPGGVNSESGRDTPLVSVVIPAYNCAATLPEALDSVARQTFRDLEVIVVDDASTDGTPDLGVKLTDRRPPCRYVKFPCNMGPAAARNRGIFEARATWVAFLDADDAWLPDRLEYQFSVAAQHPEAACFCGVVVPFGSAGPGSAHNPGSLRIEPSVPQEREERDREGACVRVLPVPEFARHNPVPTSTVLARKEAIEAVGGFDTQFRGPEDYDLWMRLAARYEVVWSERPLAMYRTVAGSLSMDDRTFLPQVVKVLEKAFGRGGALADYPGLRRWAFSNQFWNASWMAFQRGSRTDAVRHWLVSYSWHFGGGRRARRQWFRLLMRYFVGAADRSG